MKELTKKQQKERKENKGKSLEIIDRMIEQLNHTRTAIEYDKKADPYFYMINFTEDKKMGTHTLGNLHPLMISGLLQQYLISMATKK